jgi:hypothetical protein
MDEYTLPPKRLLSLSLSPHYEVAEIVHDVSHEESAKRKKIPPYLWDSNRVGHNRDKEVYLLCNLFPAASSTLRSQIQLNC